ncbi:hypothetical protein JCM5296_005363 [Sporobolomyces johnsonii]
MDPERSANGAEPPTPPHLPSSNASSTASHWGIPPAPDPLKQFSYAPPPPKQPVRVSDAEGAVGKSGGVVKPQDDSTPVGAPATTSGQAIASSAKSGRGMGDSLASTANQRDAYFSPDLDQGESDDDEVDEVVQVPTIPSAGSTHPSSHTSVPGRSSSSSGSGGRLDLSSFRLGFGHSPPRPVSSRPSPTPTSLPPLSGQLRDHPPSSAFAMVDVTSQGPAQAAQPHRPQIVAHKLVHQDSSTCRPPPPTPSTSSQQRPAQPKSHPPAPSGQSNLTAAKQHSHQSQSPQQGVSAVNPQKRPRPAEQDPSASRTRSTGSAGNAAPLARDGLGGERGVQSGGIAVQGGPKRRKAEPAAEGELQPHDRAIGEIIGMQRQLQVQNNEIRHLRQQLTDKTNELQKVTSEKNRVKREVCERARLALSDASAANDALRTTATDMRTAIQALKSEIGPISSVEQVRKELETIRSDLETTFSGSSGELWLEKNEETKVSVLKEMQAEITKRQGVISLLREQLEFKTGEIVEARDRILELEQRVADFESKAASFLNELHDVRTSSLEEKTRLADQLQATLLAATERDEAMAAKVDEMEGRWKEKVDEAERKEQEMRGRLAEFEEKARVEMGEVRAALGEKERECEGLKRISVVQREQNAALERENARHADEKAALTRQLEHDKGVHDAALEREKAVSLELKAQNDQLIKSHRAQSDDDEKRISSLRDRVAALEGREKSLLTLEEDLRGQLRSTFADMTELQQQQATGQRCQSEVARLEDTISRYEAEIERLKISADTLAMEKSAAVRAKERLEESHTSLVDENTTLIASTQQHASSATSALADASAQRARVQTLEEQLETLQSAQRDSVAQLEELKIKNEAHTQGEVKKAIEICKERHARDLAQKQNELKRVNNKLEDTAKRLQKASSELAKLKSKPVIDQHSASSSNGSGSTSIEVFQVAQAAPATSTSYVRPNPVDQEVADTSDLSSLADLSDAGTGNGNGSFDSPPIRGSTSTTGKKPLAPVAEGSKAKPRGGAAAMVVDVDDEDESVRDDENDGSAASSAAASALSKTKPRPSTKTTYSTKKKR